LARPRGGAAENGPAIGNPDQENDTGEDGKHRWNSAGQLFGQHVGEVGIDVAARNRAKPQRQAEIDGAGGERRDYGLQPSVDHQRAVERSASKAGEQHARDAERRLRRRADHDGGSEAVGKDEDHADREIDAGGDHHEGLRHGDQRQKHTLIGGRCRHIGIEAGRMMADIEGEHHDEQT
jgi:hypothetical protein